MLYEFALGGDSQLQLQIHQETSNSTEACSNGSLLGLVVRCVLPQTAMVLVLRDSVQLAGEIVSSLKLCGARSGSADGLFNVATFVSEVTRAQPNQSFSTLSLQLLGRPGDVLPFDVVIAAYVCQMGCDLCGGEVALTDPLLSSVGHHETSKRVITFLLGCA
eukprot:Lankesteria_metandrocarpae@DN4966_c0_g1_i1.p1